MALLVGQLVQTSGRRIGVLHILTRKTLGGIQTAPAGRACVHEVSRSPVCTPRARLPGVGGGAAHDYHALQGTFLGGCIFTRRTVSGSLAHQI